MVASGKLSTLPVTPSIPGTNCFVLSLTGGDTYNVAFLAGNGLVTNKGPLLYKHEKVTLEGSRIVGTTTTTTSTLTPTSSTTRTTLYGSPSCAFVDRVTSLLD